MKIKLSKGKPKGNGLFLLSDHYGLLELVYVRDGGVYWYPEDVWYMYLEMKCNIAGYKKLDIDMVNIREDIE